MSVQQKSPFTIKAAGTISIFSLVKLSSAEAVVNTATYTDCPVGVAQEAGVDDDFIAVKCIKDGGTHKVRAAGAITAGADIYAAADGEVQALPVGAGTYRKVGIALEAATAADDIIEAWLDPSADTETVSGS